MSVEAGHDRKLFGRTFIRSRLICGLRKGNQYLISFYIKSPHNIFDSVGVLFSQTDPLVSKIPYYRIVPSLYLHDITAPLNIKDSNWYKIELDYTAKGDESYIAIGYFAKNDFRGRKVSAMENRFFFFVDDISMTPTDPREGLCRGWETVKAEIYDENERHEWLEKKLHYRQAHPPDLSIVYPTSFVRIDTLVMPDILFATGKALLESQSFTMLDSIANRIRTSQVDSVVIEGHTDSLGNLLMNQKLSVDRAESVRKYLIEKTAYHQIISRGWAFYKPIDDNRTPAGRQRNRRVEVFLYIRE